MIGDFGIVNNDLFPGGVRGLGDEESPGGIPIGGGDYGYDGGSYIDTPLSLPSYTDYGATGGAPWDAPIATGAGGSTAGMSASQIAALLATAAQGATSVYRSTQSPSLVPGTQLVWNPSTNTLVPASGLNVGGLFGTSFSATGLSGMLPILLIGAAALLLLSKH